MGKTKTKRRAGTGRGPDLHFGQGGEISGFTAAGITAFSDLNPEAIVREIMQNSLDAAREAKRDMACIQFEAVKHKLSYIPGIQQYRSVFEHAKEAQERLRPGYQGLSDLAQGIVQTIETCLASTHCTTLFALDNGIGLDENRMKGILADGVSVKGGESAGAIGNGHFVVIPASDLRYVLYGGLTEAGQMIGSGHTILASHKSANGNTAMNKDGYFVKALRSDLDNPYEFPQESEVPEYLRSKLEWIAAQWSFGTVIAVPGFNNFREQHQSLGDIISKAAACNFFAAFAQKELHITVVEDGQVPVILDHTTIEATLRKFSDERRTRNKFLSGSRAFAAFETAQTGQDITVETDVGNVSLKLRLVDDGKTSIDLCRNGMWITSQLPSKLRDSQFSGLKPFHCVLLLNAENGRIHQLVRRAEGSLHNDVALKRLQPTERKELTKALEAIANKIREIVPEHSSERFKVADFLAISSYGVTAGGKRPSLIGKFRELQTKRGRTITDGDGDGETEDGPGHHELKTPGNGGGIGSGRGGRSKFRRAGNALNLRGLSVPTGTRSCRFDLTLEEQCRDSEIRFVLDESLDETCDDVGSEDFVRLKTVKVNGRSVSGNLTRDDQGHAFGVRLGALGPGQKITIEVDYELPEGVEVPDEVPVVLKTEIIRRAAVSTTQETT